MPTPRGFAQSVTWIAAVAAVWAGVLLPAPAAAAKEQVAAECVAALRANPEDDGARARLRRLFTEEYPRQLPAAILTCLPVAFQAVDDPIAPQGEPQRAFYTTGLAFPDAAHRHDPQASEVFNRVLHAYIQQPNDGEWRLAFRVLYNRLSEGAEELAPRVMRVLLQVRATHAAYLGASWPAALTRPVDVWIRGEGDGGAEQSGPNLFLLGAATPREPLELMRQIAHEFGHLALPGIGPLTAPEPWGNGFLGEMLYLRWLSRAPESAALCVPRAELAAYVRHEVEPLARAFAAAGWEGLAGQESGAGGLRLLLGMVLHLEDTRGPAAVAQLLHSVQKTPIQAWIAAAAP